MIVKFYEERIHKKSLEPIAEVLQKMESDESQSMSFIYDDMHGAKLAIKAIHGEDAQKYEPFLSEDRTTGIHYSCILSGINLISQWYEK